MAGDPTSSPGRRPSGWRPGPRWRPGCGPAPSTRSSASATWWRPGAPLRVLIEADRLTSAILWGPPGTGKTTLASVVAATTAKAFVPLSAVTAGVKDVREVVEEARRLLGEQGRGTILFLDEVHRFNQAQQDALLPSVEEGLVVLIGATTENPFFAGQRPAPAQPVDPVAPRAPRPTTSSPRWSARALEPEEADGRPTTRWPPWSAWPTVTPGPP